MIQLTEQFVPVKVNAEKEGKDVAAKYSVDGFPTILFITGSGEVEAKMVGYSPPESFSQQLQAISKAHTEFPSLLAKFKANPNDTDTAQQLAVIYATRGDTKDAQAMLDVAAKGKPSEELAKTYSAVGDAYQNADQFDRAIPLFDRAAHMAKDPNNVAYADISAAVCYFQARKPAQAVPYLKAILALPNAPKELRDQAQQMLEAARQRQ